MHQIFRFNYVVYNYEDKNYLQHDVKARNIKEALIKFVADCNNMTFSNAKTFINSKMGSGIWSVENALSLLTPLGSSSLSLYDVINIEKIKIH
jgi:hypothetical protein